MRSPSKPNFLSILLILIGWALPAFSAPFKNAKINHALNDVRIVDPAKGSHRPAPKEVIRDDAGVSTGTQSRAEIVFPEGTLSRIGAETLLRFQPGTRDLLLGRGTLLLQVPGFHGGARIRTGSLTAVLGGATVLVEHIPARSLKIVVLEGDVRVCAAGFLGDSMVLQPGKMLITSPDVRSLPEPVDVDLGVLARTSALVNPALFQGSSSVSVAQLPSMPRIERKIASQGALLKDNTLIPTNLAIVGSGTTVVIPGPRPTDIDAGDESEPRDVAAGEPSMPQSAHPRETVVDAHRMDQLSPVPVGGPGGL